jgi:hypothetical protein
VVTPKVTEIIPVASSPHIIYGKPRVKLDNDFGCPYHENVEDCLQSGPYGSCEPVAPTQYEVHVRDNTVPNQTIRFNNDYQEQGNDLTRYKSTPNLNNFDRPIESYSENNDVYDDGVNKKTKKHHHSRSKSKKESEKLLRSSKKRREHSEAEQTIYVTKILEVESRVPGKVRVVRSPKSSAY